MQMFLTGFGCCFLMICFCASLISILKDDIQIQEINKSEELRKIRKTLKQIAKHTWKNDPLVKSLNESINALDMAISIIEEEQE